MLTYKCCLRAVKALNLDNNKQPNTHTLPYSHMHTNSHTRILKASQGNFKLRLRPLDIELRWLRSFLAQLALPTYLGRPAQARRTRRRKSSGTRTATNTMTIRTRLARIAGAHFDRLAQNCLRWGFHGNWNWNWNDIRSNASQQPPIGEVVLVCHRSSASLSCVVRAVGSVRNESET